MDDPNGSISEPETCHRHEKCNDGSDQKKVSKFPEKDLISIHRKALACILGFQRESHSATKRVHSCTRTLAKGDREENDTNCVGLKVELQRLRQRKAFLKGEIERYQKYPQLDTL